MCVLGSRMPPAFRLPLKPLPDPPQSEPSSVSSVSALLCSEKVLKNFPSEVHPAGKKRGALCFCCLFLDCGVDFPGFPLSCLKVFQLFPLWSPHWEVFEDDVMVEKRWCNRSLFSLWIAKNLCFFFNKLFWKSHFYCAFVYFCLS